MERKDFLKKSIIGLGSVVGISTLSSSCNEDSIDPAACEVSPVETKGPFPNKTPADFVRENIIGDRVGVPLLINFKIENVNNNCQPFVGAIVDIWHCDSKGNYSEYARQLDGDFTNQHFLRGRQTSDSNGMVSFLSIYPGWYPGRAPHIHLEIKSPSGESLLVTQTAFPEEISKTVYATNAYNGDFDTSNTRDGIFRNSLAGNLAREVTGNNSDGYTLNETIKVAG